MSSVSHHLHDKAYQAAVRHSAHNNRIRLYDDFLLLKERKMTIAVPHPWNFILHLSLFKINEEKNESFSILFCQLVDKILFSFAFGL